MTEAAVDSKEDPSEEAEDLEPLEPDDRGKEVSPTPAFLLPPPSWPPAVWGRVPASVSVSPSARWTGRPGSVMGQVELGTGALSAPHLCHLVSGTFQQVTNLLNIMDSGSAKTDAAGAGPDMRKTLASVIITEKATTEPSVVLHALIRCLQVPEVGPARPRPPRRAQHLRLLGVRC